jgi:alkaline phosphatase D
MKTSRLSLLILLMCLGGSAFAQKTKLQSGPMVGFSEMREVMLWVQTNEVAEVYFSYREKSKSITKVFQTERVKTSKKDAFTAHCLADQVLPGKDYEATLYINGEQVELPYPITFHSRDLWHWRSDPPSFKAVVGSCNYVPDEEFDRPGKPYGGDHEIFASILKQKPDFMVWLGDNIYLREPDWNTTTGINYRYTFSRSLEVLQPLLAQTHHYAIWDDHDFGPNDSDGSFVHKDKTLQAFKNFWANPSYGVNDQPGITSMFSWSDCDFFLVDNRYHRSQGWRSTGERGMLGENQFQWLIDALKSSQATFKFVCIGGMVLSDAEVFENYAAIFPDERKRILDALDSENLIGVIFLTGDRHHSELTAWKSDSGLVSYDLTVSPLTAGSYGGDGGKNSLLVPGSEIAARNFAELEVSGPREDRKLAITFRDKDGKKLWQREILAREMHGK